LNKEIKMIIKVIMIFVLFVADLVYGFKLFNLDERVSELEKEVYIYLDPKVKEIADEATLKEGDE